MATKTIVCPECQALVVPGRYACAQCGALLASVALTPRPILQPTAVIPEPAPAAQAPHIRTARQDAPAAVVEEDVPVRRAAPRSRRTPVAPAWTHSLAAEPEESTPGPDERWDDQMPTAARRNGTPEVVAPTPTPPAPAAPAPSTAAAPSPAPATVSDVLGRVARARTTERRAAPVAGVKAPPPAKERRRSTPDPAALERIAPLAEPLAEPPRVAQAEAVVERAPRPAAPPPAVPAPRTEPTVLAKPAVPAAPAAQVAPEAAAAIPVTAPRAAPTSRPAPAAPRPEPARRPDPVPAWPPPGDRGPLAEPAARIPAGVYLPPSAVLPPGEALPLPSATNGRTPERPAATGPAAPAGTPERMSAADRLGQLDLPADTPRRVIAIGSVVATLGFLLPWTASPTGNDVIGDYLIRWGLAGPGAWIVVTLLLGLAALTLAGGRLASAPVGLPAVAMAMLVLGLAWPYLFGFGARGVGIWVVMAGLLLLAIGGVLDVRTRRHDTATPSV
jgi:hypothetical protein